VTVCIAAIADSEHIVTVNDMQLTAGGYYSAPMGSLKSFPIHPKWRVLIAGKISQKAPILGYLKETLPADESLTGAQVAKACTDAFVQTTTILHLTQHPARIRKAVTGNESRC
jgi:hypothetical protein